MSLLIVPLLYPDLAELLNFSHPFQNKFRVATIHPEGAGHELAMKSCLLDLNNFGV